MGITDHNQKFIRNPNSHDAFDAIVEGLQKKVRAYIKAKFPAELRSTRQITEFLDDTFLTYQNKVASGLGPWVDFDTKRLVGYLQQIARRKMADAKKYENSLGRDPSRVEPIPAEDLPATASSSVLDDLCSQELFALLQQEFQNEKREQNKEINLLYFGAQRSARDIEEVFREANGGKRTVSDSTILRVVANTRTRLQELVRAYEGENNE